MAAEERVEGIFQKLDPWMCEDPDIVKVGPMAELLDIRGFCFCRRRMRDGTIPKYAIGEVARGISSPARYVRALVEAGLWIDEGDYWRVRNWGKWNMLAEQRKARSTERAESGKRGAHAKWHTQAKPKCGCSYCAENGWLDDD